MNRREPLLPDHSSWNLPFEKNVGRRPCLGRIGFAPCVWQVWMGQPVLNEYLFINCFLQGSMLHIVMLSLRICTKCWDWVDCRKPLLLPSSEWSWTLSSLLTSAKTDFWKTCFACMARISLILILDCQSNAKICFGPLEPKHAGPNSESKKTESWKVRKSSDWGYCTTRQSKTPLEPT
jgi:hypothetical protein